MVQIIANKHDFHINIDKHHNLNKYWTFFLPDSTAKTIHITHDACLDISGKSSIKHFAVKLTYIVKSARC